jgi:hypothetical protein
MPGPTTAEEALAWIKEAMAAKRYITHQHFDKRRQERRFSIFDAHRVVETATACESYDAPRTFAGGTAWRVTGTDLKEAEAMVGVEAFKDHLGRRVLLVTIMDGPEVTK